MTDVLLVVFTVIIVANWWFSLQYLERLDEDLKEMTNKLKRLESDD